MTSSSERPSGPYGIEYPCACCVLMLSISKPQTNLTYLTYLTGRLDLTRFSIQIVAIYNVIGQPILLVFLVTFVLFITRIQMTSHISIIALPIKLPKPQPQQGLEP